MSESSRRPPTVLLLAIAAATLCGLGWIATSDRAALFRARHLLPTSDSLETLAATPGCAAPEEALDAEALLALLRQDEEDPGCSDDSRLPRLIAADPDPRWDAWTRALLVRGVGPERLRLRLSLAALERSGHQGPQRPPEDGDWGPAARLLLLDAEPSAQLDDPSAYDWAASRAGRRFSAGDPGARDALLRALERERRRPTLAPSAEDPGITASRALLVERALEGLGLSASLLEVQRERMRRGYPPQELPLEIAEPLMRYGSSCQRADDGCLSLLIELVQEPQLWGEGESLDAPASPHLEGRWATAAAALTEDPEVLAEIAPAVETSSQLLGWVANPRHAYGDGPWSAGQRGDPADAVRYGGSTPGASAVAALVLAEAAELELTIRRSGRVLILESGGYRTTLGPCGPGSAPAPTDPSILTAMEPTEAIELALLEQLEAALDMDAPLRALHLYEALPEGTDGRWPEAAPALSAIRGEAPWEPSPSPCE